MKELLEEIRKSGRLLAQGFTLIFKHLYLMRLSFYLDRYLASCQQNRELFYKIDGMIYRYNKIFNEDMPQLGHIREG